MQETQEMWIQSLGCEDALEKEMATLSSVLSWEIPWIEEPGGLQSMGSQMSWTQLSDQTMFSLLKYYFHLIFTNLFFVNNHTWLYPNKMVWEIFVLCGNTTHHAHAQLCLTLFSPRDCSPPGSSFLGIFWTWKLKKVANPFSKASSQPRNQIHIFTSPALPGEFFTTEPPGKPNTMHNLVNQGYLSMRRDCFYIMKCAHNKRNQDNGKEEGGSLTQQLLLRTNLEVTV